MRAVTLNIAIGPGTEISRRLESRREAMRRRREQVRLARVSVRERELEAGRVTASAQLARLIARRDAVAREVGSQELAVADRALRKAVHAGELDGLGEHIERLELSAERSMTVRTRQVLVLDRLARSFPDWVGVEAVVRGSDDVLRMHVRLEDGCELVIAANADAGAGLQTLDFDVVDDQLDSVANGSVQEAEALAALCESLFASGAGSKRVSNREKLVELSLASVGFVMSAASFPTEWYVGGYAGIVLTAVAIGMLLARHFRRS